jgi:hypothetical protein
MATQKVTIIGIFAFLVCILLVFILTFWYGDAIVFLYVYEENLSINCCAHHAVGGGYSVYTDVMDK